MSDAPGHRSRIIRAAPIILIVGVALIGAFTLRGYLNFETLRDNHDALIAFRDAHSIALAAIFVAVYVSIVGFSLPGAIIGTLTGGFLFGTALGTVLNVSSATMGAVLIFLAARLGFGETLKQRMEAADGLVFKIKRGIDANQWSMLFLIRFVPAVPFFLANLIPSFLGVPLYRFAISTFLGIIPGTLVVTSIGAGLGDVFAKGESPDLGILFEPHILLPILGLCALSLLPVIIKALSGKKDMIE